MPDRIQAPEFKPLQAPKLVRPETEILSNGIELTSFLSPEQSLISVELVFPANSILASQRQEEGYIFKMLAEGTKGKSSKQIADAVSFLGASLDFSHQADYDLISISCLSRFLPSVLRILDELWNSSVFPDKEWKTMTETQTHQNEINLQKTSFLAGRLLRKSLYTSDTDYGYSFDPMFVQTLTPEKLRLRYDQFKQTGPGLVLLAGHANNEVLSQLKDWLLQFHHCRQINRNPSFSFPEPVSGIQWENRPESQQTSLRMGQYCIDSRHSDSALLSLTLELFGGYFGSRLMSNIREDKGWTYGIYAQRVPYIARPHWVIGTDVKGDVALEAIAEIEKEALILQNEPVSEDELQKVKNYMLGQFLSSITNCFGLADRYRSIWVNGIDIERVERNQQIIKEASSEEILETARKYLQTSQSVKALAGNKIE